MSRLLTTPEGVGGRPLLTKLLQVFGAFSLEPLDVQRSRDTFAAQVKLAVAYRDATGQTQGSHWVTVLVGELSEDVIAERFREALAEKFPERVPKPKPAEAPRVTPDAIEAEIASEHYFTALDGRRGAIDSGAYVGRENPTPNDADLVPLGLVTFCVLVLRNGFTVTGESACASPENFDVEIGRKIARQNAVEQVWPLLGFRLRDRLSATKQEG